MPWRRRIAHTLEGPSQSPVVASSPWIRRYLLIGFSFAYPAKPAVRVGPLPSHQISMPSQQGLELDKEPPSASRRQEPAQSSEDGSVHGPQCRTGHLSSQDRNLVAKHDDFDGEVRLLPPREPNQLERTDESNVEEGESYAPSSSSVSRQQKSRPMGADDVFGMHRTCIGHFDERDRNTGALHLRQTRSNHTAIGEPAQRHHGGAASVRIGRETGRLASEGARGKMLYQLVWDLDGTLIDSSIAVPEAYLAAITELGGPPVTAPEVIEAYAFGVPEAILEHFLGRPLSRQDSECYYSRLRTKTVASYPGVRATLAQLKAVGHPIAVLTDASSRAASILLESASLEVDIVVGGDQINRPKPAPDGLFVVAERLRRALSSVVYIGDAPNDLQAASTAGAIPAAASWGHLYNQDLARKMARRILQRPDEALRLIARG